MTAHYTLHPVILLLVISKITNQEEEGPPGRAGPRDKTVNFLQKSSETSVGKEGERERERERVRERKKERIMKL